MNVKKACEILDLDMDDPKWKDKIKLKYREKALLYHPDKNGGDPDSASKFVKVHEAYETLIKEKEAVSQKLKELGVEESLINLKGMTQGMLVILGQKNIKKLSDFADLSTDELVGGFDEIKGKKVRLQGYLEEFSLTREEADQLIMSARNIVFK